MRLSHDPWVGVNVKVKRPIDCAASSWSRARRGRDTHKPKDDRWRGTRTSISILPPTHASWLNQVEVCFSILSAKALSGASFTAPRQVRDQIDAFIYSYNQTDHPFEWTRQVVFSQHPRAQYADLCNQVLARVLARFKAALKACPK